ncbi:MAG: heparinase II/III family protein, partial [Pseudolabrys sp.]
LEGTAVRRLLGGIPIISGPRDVRIERESGSVTLRVSHDGYASDCGVIHTRSIRLSPDGRTLDGEDSFAPVDGSAFPANAGDEFAIRFHLHPAIKANRLADGRGVILLLQDRELWTFATLADEVELEESVFLAGTDGPRRTVQIVIYGRVGQQAAVRWSFRHTPPATPGSRPDRAHEPELPL